MILVQGVSIGEGPVVVDVQIGDPVRGARLLGVVVGQCAHGGVPGDAVPAGPPPLLHIEGAALEGVAGVVLEEGDGGVGLVPGPVRIRPDIGVAGRDPRLAIDDEVPGELTLDPKQRLFVQLPRQVDAEAVDPQLLHPVSELVDDPALHHGPLLRLHLVPEGADVLEVLVGAVVVGEVQDVEVQQQVPAVHVLAGVVGHDIDDHGDPALVERSDECLELLTFRPGHRVTRTVAALHGEGVGRTVSPLIVLPSDSHGLREGVVGEGGPPFGVGVVEVLLHRHEVDHVHAQIHQVVEADGFGVRVHQSRPGHRG